MNEIYRKIIISKWVPVKSIEFATLAKIKQQPQKHTHTQRKIQMNFWSIEFNWCE